MHKLVPFKLDPVSKIDFNPLVSCADCGRSVEFRKARFVITDISEKDDRPSEEISMEELALNLVSTILCPECWSRQHLGEPKTDIIH